MAVLKGKKNFFLGGGAMSPAPEIEAPNTPSGERQRHENRGAKSAECGRYGNTFWRPKTAPWYRPNCLQLHESSSNNVRFSSDN